MADVSRRHSKNVAKNVNILECNDYFWNHHGKCIEISAIMPSSGLEILEITFENFKIFKKVEQFVHGKHGSWYQATVYIILINVILVYIFYLVRLFIHCSTFSSLLILILLATSAIECWSGCLINRLRRVTWKLIQRHSLT